MDFRGWGVAEAPFAGYLVAVVEDFFEFFVDAALHEWGHLPPAHFPSDAIFEFAVVGVDGGDDVLVLPKAMGPSFARR